MIVLTLRMFFNFLRKLMASYLDFHNLRKQRLINSFKKFVNSLCGVFACLVILESVPYTYEGTV